MHAVAASIMAFDPRKIRHLNLATKRGLGTNLMDEVLVKGQSIEDVQRPFEPPEGLEHIVSQSRQPSSRITSVLPCF